jgi:hypothetical protein
LTKPRGYITHLFHRVFKKGENLGKKKQINSC